jgi:hypothetical protein
MPFSSCEFHENYLCKSHTLLKGIPDIFSFLFYIFVIWIKFDTGDVYKNVLRVNVMKIRVKSVLYILR